MTLLKSYVNNYFGAVADDSPIGGGEAKTSCKLRRISCKIYTGKTSANIVLKGDKVVGRLS